MPHYRNPDVFPDYLLNADDERNYTHAVNHGTFNSFRGPLPPNGHERFSVGPFDLICTECGTMFAQGEIADARKNPFTCCEHGKVNVEAPPEYPEHLSILRDTFKNSLRLLNNKLCLAAYKAKRVNMPGFPWVYKIMGQVHVQLEHADPAPDPNNERPVNPAHHNPRNLRDVHRRNNAQLAAFVDPAVAMEEMRNGPGGDSLDPVLLEQYLNWLRVNNPHYEMCVRMDLLLQEQERNGEEVQVTLVFKNPGQDKVTLREHTHRLPIKENEFAALFDVGGVPETPAVYIHRQGRPFEVLPTNMHRDAFLYPVIYPWGTPRWHPGLPHNPRYATDIRNKITLRQYMKWVLRCFIVFHLIYSIC